LTFRQVTEASGLGRTAIQAAFKHLISEDILGAKEPKQQNKKRYGKVYVDGAVTKRAFTNEKDKRQSQQLSGGNSRNPE